MTHEQRNERFAEKAALIDRVVRRHYRLLRACRMSVEDIRQDLAVRMLKALDLYDARRCPNLDAYLTQQMNFELWHLTAPSKRYGIRFAPNHPSFRVLSLDARNMTGHTIQVGRTDEQFAVLWLTDEIASLPDRQRAAITKLLWGKRIPDNNRSLQAARSSLRARMDGVGLSVLPGREEAALCA